MTVSQLSTPERVVMVDSVGGDCPTGSGRLRLGWFSYLNCDPLRASWDGGNVVTEVEAAPDRLGRMVLDGVVDVAPISLVEYLLAGEVLTPLSVGAIGSDGPVMSCLLLSRHQPRDLGGRTVALSTASRTTVMLARILLEGDAGVSPTYRSACGGPESLLRDADAAVVIGDEALAAYQDPPAGIHVIDLGDWWRRWTGLPMVFALWVARTTVVAERLQDVDEVCLSLARAAAAAGAGAEGVDRALGRSGGSMIAAPLRRRYFEVLDFGLGDRQVAGIRRFVDEVSRFGALPERMGGLDPVARIRPVASPLGVGTVWGKVASSGGVL